ncbi:Tyrosyl-DNA phosphodiesterase 2 [Araneus ventricosus]|uniref:Tyrosyl-DNA phosphodiesterase 2 n=1 Tax=Araneus ventricosus TaxID=182803 RepID=A0A4Y2K497_ARAVE|nr:Tyrosyl-DNA phosphodiesterase 2 [Araneus ventricosus]
MQKVNEIFGFLSPKQLTTLDNKTLREKASTLRNLYRDDLDKDELSVEIESFKYTVVAFENKNLVLFNSHLESMLRGANARKMQLRKIFKEILASPDDTTAIFGGDLNSRDKELTQLGGLPAGIEDLWIACGSRRESEYTFDLTLNDNLIMDGQPRCRFDRIYVRHSSPRQLEPTYFGLIGLERLHPQGCFPSDHWGILSRFEVE